MLIYQLIPNKIHHVCFIATKREEINLHIATIPHISTYHSIDT